MKLFLKNISKFLIILYGSIITLLLISNHYINENAEFKLDKNIYNIVLGNSQPECAFNDSLISNFKNLAKSGEAYFYNYQKIKKILEQNPQINTVFIEFNPTNILIREDEKIWESRYINHLLPNYHPFLDIRDNFFLASKNNGGYHQAILKSLFKNLKRIRENEYDFVNSIGGYNYLKRFKTKAILDTLTTSNSTQVSLRKDQISNYDLKYLDKIIHLCKQLNITPYLIRSPYHEKYIGNIYESSFQKIRQERFANIQFLDFKNHPLENFKYADLQHLNHYGAKQFSLWFNDWLSKEKPLP